jgi:prepilin-type N-terminal cleavage/methylation domain-containing protein
MDKGIKAFTLVEILIVVGIIVVIAMIAIPNLLRVRISANEAAAKSRLKTIVAAATSYASANGGQYPNNLTTMVNSTPSYLDSTFSGNSAVHTKSGYKFSYYNGASEYKFWLSAEPVKEGVTGSRYFYTDESGVICAGNILLSAHAASNSSCPANFSVVQ